MEYPEGLLLLNPWHPWHAGFQGSTELEDCRGATRNVQTTWNGIPVELQTAIGNGEATHNELVSRNPDNYRQGIFLILCGWTVVLVFCSCCLVVRFVL